MTTEANKGKCVCGIPDPPVCKDEPNINAFNGMNICFNYTSPGVICGHSRDCHTPTDTRKER